VLEKCRLTPHLSPRLQRLIIQTASKTLHRREMPYVISHRLRRSWYSSHDEARPFGQAEFKAFAKAVNSAFQASCWHSKFAFPLRIRSEFCISSLWLALEIRILAAIP
jgi:hypothetical protein